MSIKKNTIKKVYIRISNCVHSLILHYQKPRKDSEDEKYILIPLFGMIGDAILFLDALNGYRKLFPEEKGYHIVIGCRPQVKALFQNMGLDRQFEIIILDRGKMYIDKEEFIKTIKAFSVHDYELIAHVRARHGMEDVVLYAIPGKRKVVFRNGNVSPSSLIERFFYNHTYDEVIYADEDTDQYGRYGKMLHVLGLEDYKSHVSRISQNKKEILHDYPYCILCPSSSSKEKCWPTERFARIADAIIKDYGLDVCLTGGKEDKSYSDEVMEKIKEKSYVFDFTGRTSMNSWIELIRNAELVISNDSASIHIAAAVQTPSVCIAPQHDGYRFLPYQPDVILADDCLPCVVRCARVNCFDCQLSNRKKDAQADPECQFSINKNGTFKCVDWITVEDVYEKVCLILNQLLE